MKKIIKISRLFLLISICCSFDSFASKNNVKYYLNNKSYFFSDIDVDKDGVRDKVISNVNGSGDELLFFKRDSNNYKLIFKGRNLSEDGGAGIREITKSDDNKYQLIITTNTDKLNIMNSYYISYADKVWTVNKIISTFSGYPDDYSKKYICQFDEVGLDLSSNNIVDKLPNVNLSEEFIISNCKLDYFIESSLRKYIDRFDENDINIVNGIDRYKKLLTLYPYSDKNKKDYSIIVDKLSFLGLIQEQEYVKNETIKKYAITGTVIDKSYLYLPVDNKSNMYLIKGDKVHILNESVDKNNQKWYFINYKGKKDINMWIKAEAIDIDEK